MYAARYNRISALLTLLFCALALTACPRGDRSDNFMATKKANDSVSPEIKILLDIPFEEDTNVNSFMHPAGGFLVCTTDGGPLGTVSRRDERGREQWNTEVSGSLGIAVLHIDDEGRIYVLSEEQELVVLDAEGEVLWTKPKIKHWPTPDNFGNGDDNIYLLVNEELMCMDRNGKLIWNTTRLGHSQTLLVDRDAGAEPLVYYSALEPHPDVRYGGRLIMRMCMDSSGKGIWRKQEKVRETAGIRFYPGILSLLEDGRTLLLLPDRILAIDDKGEDTELFSSSVKEGEPGILLTGAEVHLSKAGNFIICNNNQRLRTGFMRIIEVQPDGELVSDMIFDGESAGFLNSGVGSAFFNPATEKVYMFLERVKNVGKGRIAVLDREGNKLAEYESGFGYITRFFTAPDGSVIAHRQGGDLLRLPETKKGAAP